MRFLSKPVFFRFLFFLSLPDVKCTNPVLVRPSVEIYFQCDSRAAGLKDVVREFIRKANMVSKKGCEGQCQLCMWVHVNEYEKCA